MDIIYKNINLSKVFNNRLTCLEVLYLIIGLKSLVRIICTREQLKKIKKFCLIYNIYIACRYKAALIMDKNKKIYNTGCIAPLSFSGGKYVIYLSKEKVLCDLASNPALIESEKMGAMLGYPKCCVKFYMKNIIKARSKQSDFVLLTKSNKYKFSYYNNICLKPFKINLLSHFPCSFDCRASIEQAKNYERFLKLKFSKVSELFIKELRSFVVYTEYSGVHYSNDYSYKDSKVAYTNLRSSVDTPLGRKLKDAGKIEIKLSNSFVIKNKEYKSKDIGIFLFF